MKALRTLVCVGSLLTCLHAFAGTPEIQVRGLENEALDNVLSYADALSITKDDAPGITTTRIRKAAQTALQALGYYKPKISIATKRNASELSTVTLSIEPGPRVHLVSADVELSGEAAHDPDFIKLVRTIPAEAAPLNHKQFDDFISNLTSLALQKGFFDGKFTTCELGVSPSARKAIWRVHYDSGQRYRFGKFQFEGSQIDNQYLQNIRPFEDGVPYSSELLGQYNSALSQTGWFSSVVLEPEFDHARKLDSKSLDFTGRVVPKKRNQVEVGLGISTDTGPHFSLGWNKPWINRHGHSFTSEITGSKEEQTLDFSYKIPRKSSPIDQYYLLQGGYKHTDLNDTKSNKVSLAASRVHLLDSGWQRSVNLHWLVDNFTQASVSNTTMTIYPGLSFARTRSRGGAMPDWGDSQRYSLDVANGIWGSDVDFIMFQASNTWIRTLAQRHRFVLRASGGFIKSDDFDAVPPDLRFFAGGDHSIRGYDYKSISPKNSAGELTGASKMLTGTLEYQYNIKGKWWGAIFMDAGDAIRDMSQFDLKTGFGVGIRWGSPIGPVKLDIARAIGDSEKNDVQFYIGLGAEL